MRAMGIAFGLAAQLLFLATVGRLFHFLCGNMGETSPHVVPVDVALALQFAVPHSLLLLPSVRKAVTAVVRSEFYGSLYCVATCVSLWLVFSFWRGSTTTLWLLTGGPAATVRAAFIGSWVALFYSISLTGFGYQTGWTQWWHWHRRRPLPRRGFAQHGAYRRLRHPVYLSFIGLIWFTPRMTLDHAILTGLWTVYIFVGSMLKDRRLAYYLGDAYRHYASRVPGYPGMWLGPLGRWPAPQGRGISAAMLPAVDEPRKAA